MLPRIALAAALVLPTASVLAQEPSGPGPTRGQLLYDAHCIQCHTTQMHWREARVARDWRSLREQVERWQARIGERWTAEDVDAVARHLNATIYHYPLPSEQARRHDGAVASTIWSQLCLRAVEQIAERTRSERV
ncbi:MAG TPA: hypothetical protein VGF26_12460 [Ramlibacter sp.]